MQPEQQQQVLQAASQSKAVAKWQPQKGRPRTAATKKGATAGTRKAAKMEEQHRAAQAMLEKAQAKNKAKEERRKVLVAASGCGAPQSSLSESAAFNFVIWPVHIYNLRL